MSDNKIIDVFKPFIGLLLFVLLSLPGLAGCSKVDEQTLAKIDYWEQQTNIMTLLGPQKEEVFAWVYAIDPHARYSGENLTATLETIMTSHSAKSPQCIMLSIDFDERERVRKHRVWLEKGCTG